MNNKKETKKEIQLPVGKENKDLNQVEAPQPDLALKLQSMDCAQLQSWGKKINE